MSDAQNDARQSTPEAELRRYIMDPNLPKNEREWWANHRLHELVEALKEATSTVQWMSAASDFGPDGQAHEGWVRVRDDGLRSWERLLARTNPEAKGRTAQ
jgi:hypothetical protein